MKRIWFGAVMLAVLLILGFCSSTLMERTHLSQAEELDHAAALALNGNWTEAETALFTARDRWNQRKSIIAGLCDHEPMDQIEGLFGQLEIFALSRDTVSFSSSCVYLSKQLEALGKSHSLNLQNFF